MMTKSRSNIRNSITHWSIKYDNDIFHTFFAINIALACIYTSETILEFKTIRNGNSNKTIFYTIYGKAKIYV